MIAVDTSALMAIVLHEESGPSCMAALEADERLLISAGTLTEALIVAQARNCVADVQSLIDGLGFEIVPVDAAAARRAAAAHAKWGRGARSAGLNFGDCFAYDVAKENACRLLYIGRDFARTDVKSAL
ncbi:MAG: type II toxin-antitoxin system VapC family toxin [Rhizomicrobium sp.]